MLNVCLICINISFNCSLTCLVKSFCIVATNNELLVLCGVRQSFCFTDMSEAVLQRSVLARVNGTHLWDMHRPLESDCTLELLHFKDADPYNVNKAFWRTCSMILGAVAERCFKSDVIVKLHSFPSPNGSLHLYYVSVSRDFTFRCILQSIILRCV